MKTDRTVVITGAAGGMGAVFVRRFLDNDDVVIATDRSKEGLTELAGSMNSARLHIRTADITDEADTKALAELARETTGRVDVLVNVAGYFPVQPFLEMTAADWRKIIDINLTGTALDVPGDAAADNRTRLGPDRQHRLGVHLRPAFQGQAHYVAAKAGMIGLVPQPGAGVRRRKAFASTSWRPASPSPTLGQEHRCRNPFKTTLSPFGA